MSAHDEQAEQARDELFDPMSVPQVTAKLRALADGLESGSAFINSSRVEYQPEIYITTTRIRSAAPLFEEIALEGRKWIGRNL